MGGKYEIRYYEDAQEHGYYTIYTNSWFEFIKIRLTKRVIYYKIHKF